MLVQSKCHYHNEVIPLAAFVVDSRNPMNATEDTIHVVGMKISQQHSAAISENYRKAFILLVPKSHKVMNPLTHKPATHKEAHGYILCCSYAQTSTPPITQKQKFYLPQPILSPLLHRSEANYSSFFSRLVARSSITSTAPAALAEMRRPTYT